MSIYDDKPLNPTSSPDQRRDFEVAWLHRRVENLEAIVMELLRDRVPYQMAQNYLKIAVKPPSFTLNSKDLKGLGNTIVDHMKKEYPPDNLDWPPKS